MFEGFFSLLAQQSIWSLCLQKDEVSNRDKSLSWRCSEVPCVWGGGVWRDRWQAQDLFKHMDGRRGPEAITLAGTDKERVMAPRSLMKTAWFAFGTRFSKSQVNAETDRHERAVHGELRGVRTGGHSTGPEVDQAHQAHAQIQSRFSGGLPQRFPARISSELAAAVP